jgi:endonuclease YncB( thermonuclease family)
MLPVTSIACLLLAWGDAPAILPAPKDHPNVSAGVYEVMAIPSGLELVVKYDGKPTTVRLLGIDTPAIAADSKVNVLNQRNYLHGLIPIGAKVCLESGTGGQHDAPGHVVAQVRRASDGVWLNLEMLEQGFATMSTTEECSARADFDAAEQRARNAQRGMWALNFLEVAVQPTAFVPPRHAPRPHSVPLFLAAHGGRVAPPMNWQGSGFTSRSPESRRSERAESDNDRLIPGPEPTGSSVYSIVRPYVPPLDSNRQSSFAPFWGITPVSPYHNGGSFGNGSSGMPGAGHFAGFTHPGHSAGYGGGSPTSSSGSSGSGSYGSSGSATHGNSNASSSGSGSSSLSGSSSSSSSGHSGSGASGGTGHHR